MPANRLANRWFARAVLRNLKPLKLLVYDKDDTVSGCFVWLLLCSLHRIFQSQIFSQIHPNGSNMIDVSLFMLNSKTNRRIVKEP